MSAEPFAAWAANVFYTLGGVQVLQWKSLFRDTQIPRSMRTKERAARIAWRIVKDWLEAQLDRYANSGGVFVLVVQAALRPTA